MRYTIISLKVLKDYIRSISEVSSIGWWFNSDLNHGIEEFSGTGQDAYELFIIYPNKRHNLDLTHFRGFEIIDNIAAINKLSYKFLPPQEFIWYLEKEYPIDIAEKLKNLEKDVEELKQKYFNS